MDPKSKDFLILLQNISAIDTIRTHKIRELPVDLVQHPVSLYIDKEYLYNRKSVRENQYTSPWQIGFEWLLGHGPQKRNFVDGDEFTEMLKKHSHLDEVRQMIVKEIVMPDEKRDQNLEHQLNFGLQGIEAVPTFFRDIFTIVSGGLIGNVGVTFLGSYDLKWKIKSLDFRNNTVVIEFTVYNKTTMQSAARPPVIGYTDTWTNGPGKWINEYFESGWGSIKEQEFIWQETLDLKRKD